MMGRIGLVQFRILSACIILAYVAKLFLAGLLVECHLGNLDQIIFTPLLVGSTAYLFSLLGIVFGKAYINGQMFFGTLVILAFFFVNVLPENMIYYGRSSYTVLCE